MNARTGWLLWAGITLALGSGLETSAQTAAPAGAAPLPAGAAAKAGEDGYGRTPLMLAAFGGDTGAVQALLGHGADVNAADRNGMTALMWAAPEVAPLLLQRGAEMRCDRRSE